MKKASFFSWLFGYCRLEIPYASSADFMNICMRYGIVYHGFSVDEDRGSATFFCSMYASKRLVRICLSNKIDVRPISRHGFPELLWSYRARVGLLVGIGLSLTLFLISQSVLWRIDITGNERLSEDEVIKALADGGLRVGSRLSELSTDSIENRVMLASDDIAWLSVNMKGTVASVEIREVIDTKINEKGLPPANLVARRDGQITAIEVYSGFLCVEAGDYIREGQLLVSGLYDSTQTGYRYTRAAGSVYAKTTHIFSVEIPFSREIKVYSDECIEKKTLNFFGKSIKLFINSGNQDSSCDIINYEYKFDPVGLGALPVSLSVERIHPYSYETVSIDKERAEELAYYELRMLIERELSDAQLLKKTICAEQTEQAYILTCTVVCIEDIAKISEFEIK